MLLLQLCVFKGSRTLASQRPRIIRLSGNPSWKSALKISRGVFASPEPNGQSAAPFQTAQADCTVHKMGEDFSLAASAAFPDDGKLQYDAEFLLCHAKSPAFISKSAQFLRR